MKRIKKKVPRKVPHLLDADLEALPVLALNELVLLPSSYLQFHVVAPRSTEVVAWCLERGQPAIALPALLWHEDIDDGTKQFHEMFGGGLLVNAEPADDGSYAVLIRGTDRLRRVEELAPDGVVRRVRAERVASVDSDPKATRAAADRLRANVRRIGASQPDIAGPLRRMIDDSSPSALADSVAGIMVGSMRVRQRILEAVDLPERLELVLEAVAGRVLENMPGGSAAH